jgi:hypothetical protein
MIRFRPDHSAHDLSDAAELEMNDWEIVPFEKVGDVNFGMRQSELAALNLGRSRLVKKAGQRVEQFLDHGIVVCYGGPNEDQVGLIEFSGPVFPSVKGSSLDRTIKAAPTQLDRLGLHARRDRFGSVWIDALGIAFYLDGDSYAVSVFSRRDYDEANAASA